MNGARLGCCVGLVMGWGALIVQSALVVHCSGAGQDRGRSLVCGILVGPGGGNLHGVGDGECGRRR